jgi:hypothetical protein
MNKGQRYNKEEGHRSKTGRTIVRVTKDGRKYYHNPNKYYERKAKIDEERKKEGLPPITGKDFTRSKPYCYDPKSPSYMRFWKKKEEIRNEYPKWVHMNREQCREYYSRVWDLIQNDADYQQWKWETRTMADKEDDEWWEEKKRKDQNYDGHGDEYSW